MTTMSQLKMAEIFQRKKSIKALPLHKITVAAAGSWSYLGG